MFYYLDGILTILDQNFAVLDCNGVGYKLTISLLTSEALSQKKNQKVRLYTYLKVAEDDIELFGFVSNDELETFKLLLSVSGVGPKASISILGSMNSERLRLAICTEDIKGIAKAPGIGSKTAARIVLELKEKIIKQSPVLVTTSSSNSTPINNSKLTDAIEALTSLGYDKSTALNALKGLDTEKLSLNDLIAQALKKFL